MKYVLRSMLAMLPVLSMAAPAMAHNEDQLVNTEWVLVAIVEGTTTSPPVGRTTTLELREDGTARGQGPCRGYRGSYEVEGHTLSISSVVNTTKPLCPGATEEQEARYFESLESANSFDITEGELTIVYGEGQGTLIFASGN